MLAHAATGKLFNIPTILTTSAQQGPNGPLPKEILEMYPDAPLIKRQGEVDAWDNADFRAAVRATNKTQVIMAGIVTDVCKSFLQHKAPPLPQQHRQTLTLRHGTTFLALSLRAEGYSVWANVEASGTTTALIRDVSNSRMQAAGVQLVSLFSIVCDLMRDWRAKIGSEQVLPWLDQYYPVYGDLARAHAGAVENGTIIPGEAGLI
ncbi:hypothetical protein LTR16_006998 [Cryomyces antarcticus]|uniref:Isochorismatase-like domain-containing protein n=1 Tax=Cryomyces antarcticus TaxID=329879 RepID=A0ABR0LLD4_9PEZI|nr:hypothetical protein LTR16_006998 [Cryomyces antarcticus]